MDSVHYYLGSDIVYKGMQGNRTERFYIGERMGDTMRTRTINYFDDCFTAMEVLNGYVTSCKCKYCRKYHKF